MCAGCAEWVGRYDTMSDLGYCYLCLFFFFNDTATTEIYTLSLHDALPISLAAAMRSHWPSNDKRMTNIQTDRKSTRLNSSHGYISDAVFCLKKTQESAGFKSCSDLFRGHKLFPTATRLF